LANAITDDDWSVHLGTNTTRQNLKWTDRIFQVGFVAFSIIEIFKKKYVNVDDAQKITEDSCGRVSKDKLSSTEQIAHKTRQRVRHRI